MKLPRLPKGMQVRTVTPFSRGPAVEAMAASFVTAHAKLPPNKDALWEWCRRHEAVLVTFAPGQTWEELAAETIRLGFVRMVVEDPPN